MIKAFLLAILVLALAAGAAHPQNAAVKTDNAAPPDTVESKVDQLFAAWDKPATPGAAVAVIKDGTVLYKRGYGIANLEYDIPITSSTVFHVASVSKEFTAFAIALLASQGKLSLDDDIRKYLPEVPDFGKKITIRHLIHHTSGLRDQWELLAMAGWRLDDVITKAHILKMVQHEKELNFTPGDEHLYCNTGYTLLAVIVERVTGQSFRQYTQENIFKPLGMTTTHFHDDHEMIVKNRAYSYDAQKGGFKLSALNYANVGATSLFTTVEDLARWIHNFDDGKVGGKPVIEQMYQPGMLNNGKPITYAFGLDIGTYRGLKRVAHGGSDAGYRSYVLWFPDEKFGVTVLSNLGSFNPGRLAYQVADLYLANKLAPEKEKSKPAEAAAAFKIDPAIYDRYTGKYILQDGTVVDIIKESDSLFAQPAGGPKFEMTPQSETHFLLKALGGEVVFDAVEKGKAGKFNVLTGDQTIPGKRMEVETLMPADLTEYAGNYYSDELGTTYTIAVEGDHLVAQHRRHDDIKLAAIERDSFKGSQWFFQTVRFTRDKDNQVTGFRLTGSRVRNMRFDKAALR